MAYVEDLTSQLTQALRARDEVRRLVASAERLSGDESVAEEHREALRSEYAERLAASDAEVERLKLLIGDRRVEVADGLNDLRREESALEVRHKVGEFTVPQFKSATEELQKRIDLLSRLDASYGALLQANTEADVRRASKHTGAASDSRAATRVPEGRPEKAKDETVEMPATAGNGLQRGFASASAVAPKWLLYGSLGLVVVGAIAVVILFISAAGGGGFSLPNLPNPFQGGDEAPSNPTSPTSPAMPTREPTTTPATTSPSAMVTETTMPVDLRAAPNVGSLVVDLTYDPAALELIRVQAAGLPSGALFEYGVSEGRLTLGVVSVSGLNGNWSVAYLTFKRAAGAVGSGESTVVVSSVQAYRSDNLAQITATGTAGRVNLKDLSAVGPVIAFS